MRIIAGSLGGQNFDSPHGHRTHPMSEKMRGAIFSALGDIEGLAVLDAFAGSGALAIEAISRGAKSAVAIDNDKNAQTAIAKNVELLQLQGKLKPTKAFVKSWSTRHQALHFDIVFVDPPYDDIPYKDVEILPRHVLPGGILVLSWPPKTRLPIFKDLEEIQTKSYGDSQLVFYRRLQ